MRRAFQGEDQSGQRVCRPWHWKIRVARCASKPRKSGSSGTIKPQNSRYSLTTPLSDAADVLASDAPHHPPDRQNGDRNEERSRKRNVDWRAFVVRAFDEVTKQVDDIIADGGDRQSFDCRLQPQLQSCPLIHRTQQIAVLL